MVTHALSDLACPRGTCTYCTEVHMQCSRQHLRSLIITLSPHANLMEQFNCHVNLICVGSCVGVLHVFPNVKPFEVLSLSFIFLNHCGLCAVLPEELNVQNTFEHNFGFTGSFICKPDFLMFVFLSSMQSAMHYFR